MGRDFRGQATRAAHQVRADGARRDRLTATAEPPGASQLLCALASFSVDFRIGEAVNIVKMIYGVIPKNLFGSKPKA
jgi:hypothetical protein